MQIEPWEMLVVKQWIEQSPTKETSEAVLSAEKFLLLLAINR